MKDFVIKYKRVLTVLCCLFQGLTTTNDEFFVEFSTKHSIAHAHKFDINFSLEKLFFFLFSSFRFGTLVCPTESVFSFSTK